MRSGGLLVREDFRDVNAVYTRFVDAQNRAQTRHAITALAITEPVAPFQEMKNSTLNTRVRTEPHISHGRYLPHFKWVQSMAAPTNGTLTVSRIRPENMLYAATVVRKKAISVKNICA